VVGAVPPASPRSFPDRFFLLSLTIVAVGAPELSRVGGGACSADERSEVPRAVVWCGASVCASVCVCVCVLDRVVVVH
jgi:hypothetical protein